MNQSENKEDIVNIIIMVVIIAVIIMISIIMIRHKSVQKTDYFLYLRPSTGYIDQNTPEPTMPGVYLYIDDDIKSRDLAEIVGKRANIIRAKSVGLSRAPVLIKVDSNKRYIYTGAIDKTEINAWLSK